MNNPLALVVDNEVHEKTCTHCLATKPLSGFSPDPKAKHGVSAWCKPCKASVKREKYKGFDARKVYAAKIKSRYGLSFEDATRMLQGQDHTCANPTCSEKLSFNFESYNKGGKSGKAHIDHDHATGKVRGILCNACNISLGHLENAKRVSGLLQYLDKHKQMVGVTCLST